MAVGSMISPALWQRTFHAPALGNDQVHVWRIFLDMAVSDLRALQATLSADEIAKARRFRLQQDYDRFVITHGVLRTVLGCYMDMAPDQLRFRHNSYGKPALTCECGGEKLRFSLTHSNGLALYGVAYGREIGIDVEYIRAEWANISIAERFFSPREAALLRALPNNLQIEGFFNCWTRKEAYVKARGEGLSLPLDQFDVSLVPGEPAVLVSTMGDPGEAARWSLRELSPAPGYVAALAVEGHNWQLECLQFAK